PAAAQVRQADEPGLDAFGRQPAEGRPGEVARAQADVADRRRADAGHRRRHQGRGAPAALRARGAGRRRPDDLVRAARGARDGRGRGVTTLAEETTVVGQRAHSHALAETMLRFRELGIVLALVIVVGGTTIDNHLFLSSTSIQQLLSGAAIIALLAIGETIVIVTRNVDLSIGSVLGISAYATGVLFHHHPHVPLVVVFLMALGIGAACG